MASPEPINVYTDQTFQVDLETPVAATGEYGTPTLGAVTLVKARISATRGGAAIHANVDTLAASERSGTAGRFYVDVDTALLVTHVLPLGIGASFFVVWSKSGDMDRQVKEYSVADHTVIP